MKAEKRRTSYRTGGIMRPSREKLKEEAFFSVIGEGRRPYAAVPASEMTDIC
jgi:hypothetical protein